MIIKLSNFVFYLQNKVFPMAVTIQLSLKKLGYVDIQMQAHRHWNLYVTQ